MLVAVFSKGLVVGGCCFIKFIFIAVYAGEPFLHHGWKLLSNVGWVVRLSVNVLQYEFRFPKGPIFTGACVKSDFKKVSLMHSGFNGDFELVVFEQFSDLFLLASISGPEVLGRMARPSSLYRPTDSLGMILVSSSSK